MNLTICIGSSCHLKGSKKVAQLFEQLIDEKNLRDKVNFYATFCMGNCQNGISVSIDDQVYSVTPETAQQFFEKEVLSRVEE
ncbi:MAG: (2Fe-2S) ferredoxin domain-containing protein [Oscillospiraceae bacterium]|nr:(2Fe-2S) ferredoxin domain-containing protein [Oscillospiraceae bacterium]MBO5918163.1 (2Fe-2S) ferredoxin domain-containing protein [Oscillospiraceae bacterium]